MKVNQFVMAYSVEHDRLRSILPAGFVSLRPVLRINAEIRNGRTGYVEFNTAIEARGKKGWLNIGFWDNVSFGQKGKSTIFKNEFLNITFTATGVKGECPAEKDNEGCYFSTKGFEIRPSESVTANKEFCDCEFIWLFEEGGAHGVSTGKTLQATPEEVRNVYPKQNFTVENAAMIPCEQVLGAYTVNFER